MNQVSRCPPLRYSAVLSSLAMSASTISMVWWCQVSRFQSPPNIVLQYSNRCCCRRRFCLVAITFSTNGRTVIEDPVRILRTSRSTWLQKLAHFCTPFNYVKYWPILGHPVHCNSIFVALWRLTFREFASTRTHKRIKVIFTTANTDAKKELE